MRVNEVLITLGRPENRLMLPVTILDTLKEMTVKFGKETYKISFIDDGADDECETLYVRHRNTATRVFGHGELLVKRKGTEVFWE